MTPVGTSREASADVCFDGKHAVSHRTVAQNPLPSSSRAMMFFWISVVPS